MSNIHTRHEDNTYHLSCLHCGATADYQASGNGVVHHNKDFSQLHQNCHIAPLAVSAPILPIAVEVLPEDTFVMWQCAGCGKADYSIDERVAVFRPDLPHVHQLQRYCHISCLDKAMGKGYREGKHRIIQMTDEGWRYYWLNEARIARSYREAKLRLEALSHGGSL